MKFIFASDTFKGTLTCEDTIKLLTKAACEVFGEVECVGIPVADGGEGTVEAVLSAQNIGACHQCGQNSVNLR